jgi:hypothetical protein
MKNSLKIIATIHDNGEIQTLKLKKHLQRKKAATNKSIAPSGADTAKHHH